jgi:uncharacterized membrane protein YhaH (DUF805 family)
MDFQEAVRKCIRDWISIQGRAPRSEYWWFYLAVLIAMVVLQIIVGVLGSILGSTVAIILSLVVLVVALFCMVASITAGIRRLHDVDKSGWLMLIGLIPLVGLILLYFFVIRGTVGPNRFGPDPLGGDGAAQVFE